MLKQKVIDLINKMKKSGSSQDDFNEILLTIPQDTRDPVDFILYGFTIDDVFSELDTINQGELPEDHLEISDKDAVEILKQVKEYLKSDIPKSEKLLEINKEIWYCCENDGYENAFRR